MPAGREIDLVARRLIDPVSNSSPLRRTRRIGGEGRVELVSRKFLHGLGHELGFKSPHGIGRPISPKNPFPIKKNMGYTIEPGAYIAGKFGVRSEINFYINKKNQVVLTTKLQKNLIKL